MKQSFEEQTEVKQGYEETRVKQLYKGEASQNVANETHLSLNLSTNNFISEERNGFEVNSVEHLDPDLDNDIPYDCATAQMKGLAF